jgi:hypothetical protein
VLNQEEMCGLKYLHSFLLSFVFVTTVSRTYLVGVGALSFTLLYSADILNVSS